MSDLYEDFFSALRQSSDTQSHNIASFNKDYWDSGLVPEFLDEVKISTGHKVGIF